MAGAIQTLPKAPRKPAQPETQKITKITTAKHDCEREHTKHLLSMTNAKVICKDYMGLMG